MVKPQLSQQFFYKLCSEQFELYTIRPLPNTYISHWQTGQHKQLFPTPNITCPVVPWATNILQYQVCIWITIFIFFNNKHKYGKINFSYPFQYTYLTLGIHNCEGIKWCSKSDIYMTFASTNYPVATIYLTFWKGWFTV